MGGLYAMSRMQSWEMNLPNTTILPPAENDMSTKSETETPLPVGSDALVVPLHSRLDALSENAKEWLEKTCERFADGQGYDLNLDAIKECLAANLITKSGRWIDVEADVMGEVYSEGYFRHNDKS